ncbi:Ppx/GppA family phosphatase [bacterium]|nr:Ppx/GppA family phosphatase [bacterium]
MKAIAMNPRIAVIDIGTNSTLMLIAEITAHGCIKEIAQYAETTRLGRKIHQTKRIGKQGLSNTLITLRRYQTLMNRMHVEKTVVVGTQVFRLAKNREKILRIIQNETGLPVQILTENQEAEYSFIGAVSGKKLSGTLVIDSGGGSTEIIAGKNKTIAETISLPVGAVVMNDQFLKTDPPDKKECDMIKEYVDSQIPLKWKNALQQTPRLIYVGGTATTLAALHLQQKIYDPFRVDGLNLTSTDIHHLLDRLCNCPLHTRRQLLSIDPKRADIIIAGTLILQTILDLSSKKRLMIRDRGMRHGIALKTVQSQF